MVTSAFEQHLGNTAMHSRYNAKQRAALPRPLDDAVALDPSRSRLKEKSIVRPLQRTRVYRLLLQHRRQHLGRS